MCGMFVEIQESKLCYVVFVWFCLFHGNQRMWTGHVRTKLHMLPGQRETRKRARESRHGSWTKWLDQTIPCGLPCGLPWLTPENPEVPHVDCMRHCALEVLDETRWYTACYPDLNIAQHLPDNSLLSVRVQGSSATWLALPNCWFGAARIRHHQESRNGAGGYREQQHAATCCPISVRFCWICMLNVDLYRFVCFICLLSVHCWNSSICHQIVARTIVEISVKICRN